MNKRVAVIGIDTNGTKEEYFQMFRELSKIILNSNYSKDCCIAHKYNTDSEERTIDDIDFSSVLFVISFELLEKSSAEVIFHEIVGDWRENK